MRSLALETMAAVYAVGALFAEGWRFWVLSALFAVTFVRMLLEKPDRDRETTP